METYINRLVLSVKEVSLIFRVSEITVREWAKRGDLPAKKVGKKWFFHKASVNDNFFKNYQP